MILGRDSSAIPSDDTLFAAFNAGIRVWGGYFDGPGISHGWTESDFRRVYAMGMTVVAYCSGWSNPREMAAQAKAWGVDYLFLDVEPGIRPNGSWVQPWLYDAQSGLYGNAPVFVGRFAPYVQLAAYTVSEQPGGTWDGMAPLVPHGWQWRGTHDEFGISCDSAVWDDSFAPQLPAAKYGDYPMIAVRPDGSASDYFLLGPNNDLATGSVDSSGVQTASYTPEPYADHPLSDILGMGWSKGCLTVQVKGTDGIEYLAIFVGGNWLPYLRA